MVIVSPLIGVVGPLPNGLLMARNGVTNYLLSGGDPPSIEGNPCKTSFVTGYWVGGRPK